MQQYLLHRHHLQCLVRPCLPESRLRPVYREDPEHHASLGFLPIRSYLRVQQYLLHRVDRHYLVHLLLPEHLSHPAYREDPVYP